MKTEATENDNQFYQFLPPVTKLGQGYVFTSVCDSVHGGGLYPSMPCSRSPGVVSQHALQVSRPTPRGGVEGDLARGVSRPTPKAEVEGGLVGGPQAHTSEGLQTHT